MRGSNIRNISICNGNIQNEKPDLKKLQRSRVQLSERSFSPYHGRPIETSLRPLDHGNILYRNVQEGSLIGPSLYQTLTHPMIKVSIRREEHIICLTIFRFLVFEILSILYSKFLVNWGLRRLFKNLI